MNKGSLLMNNTSKRRKEKSENRIKEKPKKAKKKCHEVNVHRNGKNDQFFSTMEERRELSKFDSLSGKIMAYFLKL